MDLTFKYLRSWTMAIMTLIPSAPVNLRLDRLLWLWATNNHSTASDQVPDMLGYHVVVNHASLAQTIS